MSIDAALVGARGTTSGSAVTTTAGTSTGGSGNHGVLVVSFDPGVTISSVVDTTFGGNTFSLLGAVQNDVAEGKLAVYTCLNWTGGASHAVQVNFSGTAFATAHLINVTGAATSPIDIDVPETDTVQPCSANSGILAQAAELILIIGACNEIAGDGAYTTTTGTILSSEPAVTSFWTSGVAKAITASTADTAYDIRRNAPTTSGGGHIRLISFKEATSSPLLELMGQACL